MAAVVGRSVTAAGAILALLASLLLGTGAAPASAIAPMPPDAPKITGWSPTEYGDAASISFEIPDDGGSPITGYQFSIDDGGSWASAFPTDTEGRVLVAPLTPLVQTSVALRAVNSFAAGAASDPVLVTSGIPSAPRNLSVTAGDSSAVLRFTPPEFNGGVYYNEYEYSLNGDAAEPTWVSTESDQTEITITGISNGTTYVFAVRAVSTADNSYGLPATVSGTPGFARAATWGSNNNGQLGAGTSGPATISSVPLAVNTTGVLAGKVISQVTGGSGHACALTTEGEVFCWGSNSTGQLGDGTNDSSDVPVAVDTSGALDGKTVAGVDAGGSHTCARTSDGAAYCWGNNNFGQLGNNSTTNSNVPVAVDTSGVLDGKTVTDISTGLYQSCVATSDGDAYCWGYNFFGQLGTGTNTNSSVPVAVSTAGVLASETVMAVAAGQSHTCALNLEGEAFCWGANWNGQLGNNSATNSNVPVSVSTAGVLSGKSLAGVTAGVLHTCGWDVDGDSYCWGSNGQGQLGTGNNTSSTVPVAVSTAGALADQTVADVAAGDYHTCAATSASGQGYCWGSNDYGELGDGTETERNEPTAVVSSGVLSDGPVTQVAAGAYFSLAVYNGSGATAPAAPTELVATPGVRSTSIAFTAGDDGGEPITDYQYRLRVTGPSDWSEWTSAGVAVSPVLVTGLADATAYDVQLRAVNVIGTGAVAATSVTTPGLPAAPEGLAVTATGGSGELEATFTAGADGGSPITDYEYRLGSGEPAGTPDAAFNVAVDEVLGGDFLGVEAVLVQPDGKIVVGGSFTSPSRHLARFNADGTPDTAFNSAVGTTLPSEVSSLALQSDGKILVGGAYAPVAFTIKRYNADGTPDSAFNNNVEFDLVGNSVDGIAVQPDGKIVIGGAFFGPSSSNLARLNANGTQDFDFSFLIREWVSQPVTAVAIRADGGVLVGFGSSSGPLGTLALFTKDGNLDFDFSDKMLTALNGGVDSIAIQPDGKVIVGGNFTSPSRHVARFESNGDTDTAFVNAVGFTFDARVRSVAVQSNGSIIVGGDFIGPSNRLARLNASGTPDTAFNSAVGRDINAAVYSVASTADDAVLAGGRFSTPANALARFVSGYGAWTSAGVTESPFTISGLTNGTTYDVQARAVNAVGAGAAAGPVQGAPEPVPTAPTNLRAIPRDGGVTISFTPGDDFGEGIDNYEYRLDGGEWTTFSPAQTTSPVTITGLNNYTSYSVELRAVNSVGDGAASAPVTFTPSPGRMFVWGDNNNGGFGDGTTGPGSNVPVVGAQALTDAGESIVDVDGGGSMNCAATQTGEVYCWGFGYFGDGEESGQSSVPVQAGSSGPMAGKTIIDVAVALDSACALSDEGQVFCWGDGFWGTLGNGSYDTALTPVAVDTTGALAGKTVTQIAAGAFFACALTSDGSAYCWGSNSFGALGIGTVEFGPGPNSPRAVDTSGALSGRSLTEINAGSFTSCATDTAGVAYCWGRNSDGQLGNGTTDDAASPTPVTTTGPLNGAAVVDIAVGDIHACAVLADGTAACWGNNEAGQLGTGTTDASLVPVAVVSDGVLSGQTLNSISVNEYRTCAVADSGSAFCWGSGSEGGLGNGSDEGSLVPSAVVSTGALANSKVVQVVVNAYDTLAWAPIPVVVPGAPTELVATPLNGSASIAFTPGPNVGPPITNYEYTLNPSEATPTWRALNPADSASPVTVTGLTNGTEYSIALRAVNEAGGGAASDAVVVRAGVPSAPLEVVATPGDSGVAVAFEPPESDGGSPVTNYEYRVRTAAVGEVPAGEWGVWVVPAPAWTFSPLPVMGLVNGTAYEVQIRAVNVNGAGVVSEVAGPVTPSGGVDVPTGVVGVLTDVAGEVLVSWTAPVSSGGVPVTSYEVQAFEVAGPSPSPSPSPTSSPTVSPSPSPSSTDDPPEPTPTPSPTVSPSPVGSCVTSGDPAATECVVEGLALGSSYVFVVTAMNEAGSVSDPSVASAPVLVVGPAGAPTGLVGVPTGTSGQVEVEFTAGDAGGGTISDYEYTIDGGVSWVPVGTDASPVVIDGLDDGTAYTVALRAVNEFGAGETSASVVVTPRTTPGAPTELLASPGDSSAVISFTAGGDGGAEITNYEYQLDGGAWTVFDPAQDGSPVTVSGLTNGTEYSIALRAVNAAGAGVASDAVVVTPRTVPGAPTITTVTPGDGQVSVNFAAPVSNGGAAITDYEYRVSGSTGWDAAFNSAIGTQLNGSVQSVVVQSDGKIVVGGEFTTPANYLARFNADGTPDTEFNTNVGLTLDDWVTTVAMQPDGDVVVGGLFSTPSNSVARFNSNGTPDTTFNTNVGTTLSDFVSSVVVQPDGKIVVGGEFTAPASPSSGVARFNADGSADAAFNSEVGLGLNAGVDSVALQSDGRIVAGGGFTSPSARLARFNTDGSADDEFNQAVGTSVDGRVFSVAVQPDGGVVVGGLFAEPATYLARFTAEGAPDPEFNTNMDGALDGAVTEVALDADDGVMVGGFFSLPSGGVARFGADGTPDVAFNTVVGSALNDRAYSVVQDADGNVVVGGMFTAPSSYLARLDGGVGPWTSAGSTSSPITVTGLVNGTSYEVALRAVNPAGAGAASGVSAGVVPFGKPQAPGGVAGSAGPGVGQVTVSWDALVNAPDVAPNNNGALVSQYAGLVYSGATFVGQCRASGQESTGCVVSGLTPGSYTVLVRARNAAGWGPSGVGAAPVSPAQVAGAPTVVSVVAGDGQVVVGFTAPADSGGVPVTNYQYTIDGGVSWVTPDPAVTASPLTVTGLTNGDSYSVGVRAVTSAGAGAASSPLVAVVPRTVPGAPDVTTVSPGDQQITVAFTAPDDDGGADITNYEYSIDGGESWVTPDPMVTSSPLVIDGVTNGTAYDVAIRAVNVAGAGAASDVSEGVVPFGKPQAPGNVAGAPVAGGAGQVRISWDALVNAPSVDPDNNGAVVSQYAGLVYSGATFVGQCRAAGQESTGCVVSGLTPGVSYTVLVRARNAAGWGPSGVGGTQVAPFGVPGAPAITTTNPGDASFAVGFTAAAANGAAITNYQFSTDGGVSWRSLSPPVSGAGPFAVIITRTSTGAALVNGTTYQVQLRGINSFGAGAATASTAVTLPALPGAPVLTAAVPTNTSGQVSVAFDAPDDVGVPEVSNYQFSVDDGLTWQTRSPASTGSPLVIGGLMDGQEYQVKLRAVNTKGAGPASNMLTVTPRTTPGAPAITTITEGDQQLSVVFTAPADDGGAAITNYAYSTDDGANWVVLDPASTVSPIVITGLINGTTYQVKVRAINAAGDGRASVAEPGTPRTTPSAPQNLAVAPNNLSGQLEVTWDAPGDDGGSAITMYEYRLDGGSWLPGSDSPLTLAGLTNGTEYEVEIRAVNAAGGGTPAGPVSGAPRTVPSAPQGLTATHGDASAVLSFGVPADDGGAGIDGYEYSTNDGVNWLVLATTGSAPVTATITTTSTGDPLVNGDLYEVKVRAVNAAGEGASASVSFTPSTRPAAPTVAEVIEGDEQLVVSWEAPDDGGAMITSYLAIAYDSDGIVAATCRVTGAPPATGCTITGLVNGQEYTVAVRATNLNGQGPQNTPVGPYTPTPVAPPPPP